MLTEFYCVVLTIVPIIIFGELFSQKIELRQKNEIAIHSAVRDLFFKGECKSPVRCSDDEIYVKGAYKIKIRKPANPFNQKSTEEGNEILDSLYSDLEKAIEGDFNK